MTQKAPPWQFPVRWPSLIHVKSDRERAALLDWRDRELEERLAIAPPVDPTGPEGPPGPIGPAGPAGATQTVAYIHHQGAAAAVWTIPHALGWYPNVTVIDSAGSTVEGDVAQLDANTLRLTFSGAFAGTAYLS